MYREGCEILERMPGRSGQTKVAEPLRIVAIGGGNGLSSLLHGFKRYMRCEPQSTEKTSLLDLTAVVTVTDDGGSSGRLRRDFDVLPPGDIRNCLVAMSEDEALLSQLFQYRFDSGKGLKGHSLGNLFLTALTHLTGDFARAVQHASEVLATCGRIYPSTSANVVLRARMHDGSYIEGETKISKSRVPIDRIGLRPERCKPLPDALRAIAEADLITLGPGSLYTSIIPNLLVSGIGDAIRDSKAMKLYFVNLMWQPGETMNFAASDHVKAICKHSGCRLIDVVAVNTRPIPRSQQQRYARQQARPVENDLDELKRMGVKVVERELALPGKKVRHDPSVIAKIAIDLAGEGRRRKSKAAAKGK